MKAIINVLIRSILAGIMISFGCVTYLSCDNQIIGACLFSFGLLTIIFRDYCLYTGKIGYVRGFGVVNILTTLVGNFIGTYMIGALVCLQQHQQVQQLVCNKLSIPIFESFILSVFCGIMMFLAVDSYRRSKSWLFVMLPVVIFIICGFEHSIANMCYLTLADAWSTDSLMWILVIVAGNGIGSYVMQIDFSHNKTH